MYLLAHSHRLGHSNPVGDTSGMRAAKQGPLEDSSSPLQAHSNTNANYLESWKGLQTTEEMLAVFTEA